ncbi:MAG: glycine--tRNA ligase [Candidatus Nitrosocaldus sp.]|nr:glycine--tRNA ligase [Candidatus Nitrosocaldus sp.]MCS7140827.1 glycine--tRNA ligase [Candidatus Nitrosocaldus sp.]MDW7999755.1 glycine--tRNA ligase [Candidatus Nitrosocaldus sp.]MDW8274885.1 glycine--tRNA ligase [Candidatus Nitrosocaldus sp.]
MNYDAVTELALSRGFYFPSCEIYADAQAGFWEYGPLGVALKNRYVELWRRELVRRDGMLEIDGSQIMSRSVFVASGHLESFNDPVVRCTKCSSVHRADRLVGEVLNTIVPERMADGELGALILKHGIRCPKCGGELGSVSRFNMMFKVSVGADGSDAYLRPETCQSIFVDFARLFKIMRCKLPVAIAQVGKSFRNEIAPRQSLMRLREFYQAEIEVFCNPRRLDAIDRFDEVRDVMLRVQDGDTLHEVSAEQAIRKGIVPNRLVAYYLALLSEFYSKTGIDMSRSRFRRLAEDEKAFYATVAYDFEVHTSLGWVELVACNYRSDHDLKGHMLLSKENMEVMDVEDGNSKVLPHVFELSMGIERSIYCILEHSLQEDRENDRLVLRLRPYLAPVQVGILPIVKKDDVEAKALEVFRMLRKEFDVFYDDSGSIGRRYRRLDEIGTPYAITIDRQTLEDGTVTIRERDSMNQVRVRIESLRDELAGRLRPP